MRWVCCLALMRWSRVFEFIEVVGPSEGGVEGFALVEAELFKFVMGMYYFIMDVSRE